MTTRAGWAAGVTSLLLALGSRPSLAGDPPKITTENASMVKAAASLLGHKMAVFSLAFSPDSSLLASAGIDKTVRLWDARVGKQAALLEGHTQQAIAVAFRDNVTAISAGYDRSLRIWDVKSAKQVEAQTKTSSDPPQAPGMSTMFNAFTADASTLAYVDDGGFQVYVWDVRSRSQREIKPRGPESMKLHFRQVAFSGNGRWLAAQLDRGDDTAVVELWDMKEGKWGNTLEAPEKTFVAGEALAVDAEGTTVASVDIHSSAIQLWDAKTGKRTHSLAGHQHDANSEQIMISALAFSPDGRLLASSSYDKTIRLWDVASGKELVALPTHGQGAADVAFSPDGRWLATSDLDGSLQLWSVAAD